MDRAFAGGTGWRWLYLSDLFHRAGFFHRSRRLHRCCGTRHLRARYLGVSLGACRHGLLLLLRAVDLLRRALSVVAQGESLRNSSCLRLYGAGHVNQATGGKWLSDFIYIHHLKRYTAGAGHRQPFYYYFTTLPADFLPWTVFAIPALLACRPYRRAWDEPVGQFFFVWFLAVFVFFSISDTKRDLYLLPLLPTLALLERQQIQ